jgi:hypothetical protein
MQTPIARAYASIRKWRKKFIPVNQPRVEVYSVGIGRPNFIVVVVQSYGARNGGMQRGYKERQLIVDLGWLAVYLQDI